MACYHPLHARFDGYFDGVPQYKVDGSWLDARVMMYDPRDKKCPCGHCVGCRLDRSRQWADRMMLELDHTKKGVFITLTYDDFSVPVVVDPSTGECDFTLDKRDCQLFLKRLRKAFPDIQIRFYLAGEYGSVTHRPHYHAILFGLGLDDFIDRQVVGKNPFGQLYYSSSLLAEKWSHGFVSLSEVSWQTCAYVARYVTKKLPSNNDGWSPADFQQDYFALMSRRPGIAGYFLDDHPDLVGEMNLYIDDPNGVKSVKKVRQPKYLLDKLEISDPDMYNKLKADRERFAKDRELLELHRTDLDEIQYRTVKEERKLRSLEKLKRADF